VSETEQTKESLRTSSLVTFPRFLAVLLIAAGSFPLAAYIVTIEPVELIQDIAVWVFFPSAAFVMMTVAATVGYLFIEKAGGMDMIQQIHRSDYTRMSDMPVMRRFVLRELIL
jgi:hypothetical protein